MSDTTSEALMRDREIAAFLNIGRSTWWAWVRDGRAPAPVKVNKSTRWHRADVLSLLKATAPTNPSTSA